MYPHERSLVKQLADKPFALIGVNSDSDIDEIREIVKEKKLTWRSFQDAGGDEKISDKWKVQGWPTVFILDAEGKIRYKGHGASDSTIEECLAELGYEVKIRTGHEDEEDEAPEDDSDEDAEDESDEESEKESEEKMDE